MRIAGLDVGTSAARLLITDESGHTIWTGEHPYPTHTAPVGQVQQDPHDWWSALIELLAESGLARQIDAIGLTGQMQDLIVCDPDATVRRPAILYSDTRAARHFAALHAALPAWEAITANLQDPAAVAAKLAWLTEHEPGILTGATVAFGPSGYLGARLGGRWTCDLTTASTTGLLSASSRSWSDDVLAATDVAVTLPELVQSGAIGTVSPAAAAETGLRAGIPIVMALGDAGSTTDGLVGSEPGDAYVYLGTTGWLAVVTDTRDLHPSPIFNLLLGPDRCLRIGAVASAGATADWARHTFLGVDWPQVDGIVADRVTDLSNRPLCLPGLDGERAPVRDGDLSGAFVAATSATTPSDLYLAALTGVAMCLKHVADDLGVQPHRLGLTGGGSVSAPWRQIFADVFNADVVAGSTADPAAFSAARAAARHLGVSPDWPHLIVGAEDGTLTAPSTAAGDYAALTAVHRSLYQALAPAMHTVKESR